MHTVKLTVYIDDPGDIDMEVRVVAPDTVEPVVIPSPTPVARTLDDDYVLGGYAGI